MDGTNFETNQLMQKVFFKYNILATLTIVLGLLISCSKTTTPAKMSGESGNAGASTYGGVDSGGADVLKSGKSAVLAILEKEDVLKSEVATILFNSYKKSEIFNVKSNVLKLDQKIIDSASKKKNIDCILQGKDEEGIEACQKNIFLSYVKNVRMKIQDGACLDKADNQKLASVSEFNSQGTVCWSVSQFSALPADSLKKQIHTTFIHEIAHLFGYVGEAVQIQQDISDNYDVLFTDKNQNYLLLQSILSNLAQIEENTARLIHFTGEILRGNLLDSASKNNFQDLLDDTKSLSISTSTMSQSLIDVLTSQQVQAPLDIKLISILDSTIESIRAFRQDTFTMGASHVSQNHDSNALEFGLFPCEGLVHRRRFLDLYNRLGKYVSVLHDRQTEMELSDEEIDLTKDCQTTSSEMWGTF